MALSYVVSIMAVLLKPLETALPLVLCWVSLRVVGAEPSRSSTTPQRQT